MFSEDYISNSKHIYCEFPKPKLQHFIASNEPSVKSNKLSSFDNISKSEVRTCSFSTNIDENFPNISVTDLTQLFKKNTSHLKPIISDILRQKNVDKDLFYSCELEGKKNVISYQNYPNNNDHHSQLGIEMLSDSDLSAIKDVSTVQALENSNVKIVSSPVFEKQKYSHFKRQQNKYTMQGLWSSPIVDDVSESCSRRQIHCDTTACCLRKKRHGASSRLNQVSGCEMSLSQEVFESMAALMEDEEAAGPSWAACYVSYPDVLNDRCEAPKAILCSDIGDVDPPSPILGRFDRFSSRRHQESKRRLHFASTLQKPSSFKVPYKDTVAPSTIQPAKRMLKHAAFGTPFLKRSKLSHESENCSDHKLSSEEVSCARQKSAFEQERIVETVSRGGQPRLVKGSHLLTKIREPQMSWRQAAGGRLPGTYSREQLLKLDIKEDVIDVTASNAVDYRFSAHDFYSSAMCRENVAGVPVGDGSMLILDSQGLAGVVEVTRAFLASPGVDPSLSSTTWVHNHYRWIVWKLAATERSFPLIFAHRCLSPNNVMLQLKYRYDREIDRSQRPALRKILEKDDTAAKRLVLCVARVVKSCQGEQGWLVLCVTRVVKSCQGEQGWLVLCVTRVVKSCQGEQGWLVLCVTRVVKSCQGEQGWLVLCVTRVVKSCQGEQGWLVLCVTRVVKSCQGEQGWLVLCVTRVVKSCQGEQGWLVLCVTRVVKSCQGEQGWLVLCVTRVVKSCQGEQGWLDLCVTRVVKVSRDGWCRVWPELSRVVKAPLKSPVESKMETMISPRYELEVTDGWYGILASVDVEMCRLIESKIVTIGTKLMTHSAELLNCDQGCSPPEEGHKPSEGPPIGLSGSMLGLAHTIVYIGLSGSSWAWLIP
uniref:Breast cancer type 2 susceptibility protein n=1 Tax=Timema monikensis TaxID=170555 RepID=A0A7R9HTL2_9NEOP|nr:unnamed protein product [Timema monikensis]